MLTARGDHGYDPGGRIADLELVVPSLAKPLAYLGVTDVRTVSVEYDEFQDERLAASLAGGEAAATALAEAIAVERSQGSARAA